MTGDKDTLDAEDDALLASAVDGLVGGLRLGGRLGARLGLSRNRRDACVIEVDFATPPSEVVDAACRMLAANGDLEDIDSAQTAPDIVRILARSGFLDMNPCVVRIEVTALPDGVTRARIRGIAMEGLIDSRTAAKAVARVQAGLSALLPAAV